MKKFNGEQLRKARVYRGYTVGELAELLGCQRQTISMYENGKSTPGDISVVFNISRVLNFPPQFFSEDGVKLDEGSTYFRALLTTNKKYRNQQEQKLEFLASIYSFIQEYVHFPKVDLPKFSRNILTI
jgi:transcriptional regulator with XRE-family HTH domain